MRARFLLLFVMTHFSSVLFATEGVSILPKSTGTFRTNLKYMAEGVPSEEVTIPIPFYVVRHPLGIVLFDSGLGEEFPRQVSGWWVHRIFQYLLPCEFEKPDAAAAQLRSLNIAPEDIRYIVVSHLHYDHAGGLRDFPKATVVVSRAEWEHAHVGRWKARLRGVMSEQLEGISDRLMFVEDRFDLFGDGSLTTLSTPGHTPGHQSLLVKTGSGKKVLLTGDAVWLRENYERPTPKSRWVRLLEEDAETAWQATLKIREFAERNPEALIIPGHDPRLWKTLPEEIQ